MVVLPAPKPPAMRIFRAEGTVERSSVSESVDAIENRLEYVPADRALGFVGGKGQVEPAVEEVTEQGLDDGDRDVQVGGHLSHRLGASIHVEDEDLSRFEFHLVHLCTFGRDADANHALDDS